jgi:phosphomannomutase
MTLSNPPHSEGAKAASVAIKFGTDGWRGVIAEDFTDENIRKVSHAIARYAVRAERPGSGILVGYDTRFGSERFARVAASAVAASGTPVWLAAEACPTPAISLLVRLRGAAGGIQITASHNPYRWNGIKYKASYGSSASSVIVAQIEMELDKVLRDGVPALPPREDLIHSLDVRTVYLETLGSLVDWDRLRASKFRFLIDPMHGAGRGLLRELFHRHGIEAGEIRGRRDPLFGGVNPERCAKAATTWASRSMAMRTASEPSTVTARLLRRTKSLRFSCGTLRARENSRATWRNHSRRRK